MFKSPKTTIAGLLAAVVAVVSGGVIPFLQGNAVNWGTILVGFLTAVVGVFASDHSFVTKSVSAAIPVPVTGTNNVPPAQG